MLNNTFYGASLREAIDTVNPERKAIIENFLYEKSALLLYADDGVGKSVICLQACMTSTVENAKVFGDFLVPQARNVIYFQMERHPDETFERMRRMESRIPFDITHFCLSADLQGINLQDRTSRKEAIDKVNNIITNNSFFTPDIIAFDPIYSMVADDLSKAEPCNAITSFFREIQVNHNVTILATSHTNRGTRDTDNPHQRVGKDMYGNRFLSAFFTGSYHLESKDDGAGSNFKLNKNSQRNLEKQFSLNYDPATYCSWSDNMGKLTKSELLIGFLNACKKTGKNFTFKDMETASKYSESSIRKMMVPAMELHSTTLKITEQEFLLEEVGKLNKGKALYKIAG